MARILFILKARDNAFTNENSYTGCGTMFSSGLFNSASFVKDMLAEHGHITALEHAVDNNKIDKLVTEFKADIVVIEAYWVVPEKFEVLTRLHPKVKWIIRNHSATPFASTEGVIMDWSIRYMTYKNVSVACNDTRTDEEFFILAGAAYQDLSEEDLAKKCFLLPNYYPETYNPSSHVHTGAIINVSCFGAVRPLKNHLMQAVAAIRYAKKHGKKLRFHINATRIEGRGEPILNNIKHLFKHLPDYELIEHNWMPHDEFVELCRTMDIGLQVSYSETFNIVAADMVANGVPVVTSSEIKWVHQFFYADPNCSKSIVKAMEKALYYAENMPTWTPSMDRLKEYNRKSVELWLAAMETEK